MGGFSRGKRDVGDEHCINELINKETKYQDGFMERELNPPPSPPSYEEPGDELARPHEYDKTLVAVGCVPAGASDDTPATPRTRIANRARLTEAVSARMRARLLEAASTTDPTTTRDAHFGEHLTIRPNEYWRQTKTLEAQAAVLSPPRNTKPPPKKPPLRRGTSGGVARRLTTTEAGGAAAAAAAKRRGAFLTSVAKPKDGGLTAAAPKGRARPKYLKPRETARAETEEDAAEAAPEEEDAGGGDDGGGGGGGAPPTLNFDDVDDRSLEELVKELRELEAAAAAMRVEG